MALERDIFGSYVKQLGKSITAAENPFNIRHVNRGERARRAVRAARDAGAAASGGGRARGAGARAHWRRRARPRARSGKKPRKKAVSARQCLTDALGGRTLGRSERRRDPRPAAAAAPCPRWPCATSRSTAPCACATRLPGRHRAPSATTVSLHHHRPDHRLTVTRPHSDRAPPRRSVTALRAPVGLHR
ncbi:unnamed protein product, partial [Brenthis ino]